MSNRALAFLALVLAAGVGCTKRPAQAAPGPVVSVLIALDAELGGDAQAASAAFATLQDIAGRVERRHRRTHAELTSDISAVLFDELGFEREIESADTRFFRLSTVLAGRRGSCLGLGALVMGIAERVGAPVDGILLPGHFFVRTRGPQPHNVELLRRGEAMGDDWYRAKYGPWPGPGSAYFRPLSPTELAAIHWYNHGNDRRKAGQTAAAQAAFARATSAFPDFAEAQASLGAVEQLRGDFASAALSYGRAARAWPDLPGLAGNIELLQRQLAAAAP